jgi:hypothetical protein
MTEKRAYILLFIAAVLLQGFLTGGLILIGAGSDALVLAYALLVCGAGLGVGLIDAHYR